MFETTTYNRLLWTLIHLGIGVLLLFSFFTKIYSLLIVVLGIITLIDSKNKYNDAVYFSAYMVGAEVAFRMSGGLVFYELPKYSVLLFMLLGLIVEKRNHHISYSFIIYIFLLLIGITFVNIPFNESIRKAIAFNLSGPITLGVCAIYFYNRTFTYTQLLNVLFWMLLPIISMLSLLYFRTPNISEIAFGSISNFEASGGFGPNQVATILGLGVFIVVLHLYYKRRLTFLFISDIFLLCYLLFRGLITFSRGGMLTAAIAIFAFTLFYVLAQEDKLKILVKYTGLVILFGFVLFIYTSNITGGMLTNRYTNKNSVGVVKEDLSTGRLTLFKTEVEAMFDKPFFGIGVGGAKFYRAEELGKTAASHNELSRLLSEHGMIGILILLILLGVPTLHLFNQPLMAMGFLSAFLLFWFLTINHSAMRIAFPAFIYGLSLINLKFDD